MLNNYQTGSDISRKWSIRSVILFQPLNHIQHRIIKEITSAYMVFHAEGLTGIVLPIEDDMLACTIGFSAVN